MSEALEVRALLPRHVTAFRDRHGKMRYRFRRGGFAAYIQRPPDHPDFSLEYEAMLLIAPKASRRAPLGIGEQVRGYLEKRDWPLRGSYVYFLAGPGGVVKIGFSSLIVDRLRNLVGSSPYRLRLLALMPGDQAVERTLHERFASDKAKGEWFRRSPAIRALISELKNA